MPKWNLYFLWTQQARELDSDVHKGITRLPKHGCNHDLDEDDTTPDSHHGNIIITHVVVLRRYPVVLVLVRFFRLPLVRAYARDPVQRVLLHAVAHAPYGPAGRVQLVQQLPPGAGHQAAAGRRVAGTAAVARDVRAALEALRAHRGQRRGVLAVALELAGNAPAHHLQHPDLGLLPAHQSLVLRLALGRGVVATGVPHPGGCVPVACRRGRRAYGPSSPGGGPVTSSSPATTRHGQRRREAAASDVGTGLGGRRRTLENHDETLLGTSCERFRRDSPACVRVESRRTPVGRDLDTRPGDPSKYRTRGRVPTRKSKISSRLLLTVVRLARARAHTRTRHTHRTDAEHRRTARVMRRTKPEPD